MDFIQLYHKVLARWQVTAYAVAVCVFLALLYLLLATRIYSSVAVFQVQQKGGNLLGTATNTADEPISPEVLNTIQQSFTSQSFMLRMIHVGHLGTDPKFVPPKSDGTPYLDSELLKKLQEKMSVNLRKGTRLIDVTIEDRDPVYAQELVQLSSPNIWNNPSRRKSPRSWRPTIIYRMRLTGFGPICPEFGKR
jgi:succinoglycan biosynthesis transport protein ExoP